MGVQGIACTSLRAMVMIQALIDVPDSFWEEQKRIEALADKEIVKEDTDNLNTCVEAFLYEYPQI
jgi:hypothetical protein